MLMAGTFALMRWGPALPDMVLAAEPVADPIIEVGPDDDIESMEEPPATAGEIEALTDPIEDVVEPEVTDTTPPAVDPAVTTGDVQEAAPQIVTTPASPAQTLPRGRWVLFDRNGQPVDAVVEPWCIESVDDCPEFGAIAPSCVWVEWLGQLRVRVPFRLSDGDPNVCYSPLGTDRHTWHYPPADIATAMSDAPYSLELVYWD